MRVLLTGATGFIGGALLDHFASKGYQVSIIVRPNSELGGLQSHLSGVKVYRYSGEYAELNSAVKESKPNVVVHVASLFLTNHGPENLSDLIESNIEFPARLLEAMVENNIKHFINTGTSWQSYGDSLYDPVNLYAATKQAFEDLAEYYIQADGVRLITLRLFDSYGPKDSRKKLFFLLRSAVLSQVPLRMSPGLQTLDLVFISDIVDAYDRAIELVLRSDPGGSVFGINSNQRYTLKDIVKIYSNVVKRDLIVEWSGLDYRRREVMIPCNTYARLPNWTPKVDLMAGIEMMENDSSINGLLAPCKK